MTHIRSLLRSTSYFFFNDTATTEIYTLSLHDALPISSATEQCLLQQTLQEPSATSSPARNGINSRTASGTKARSEEHTSELQSQSNLVCRLLLEKKKKKKYRK